MDFRAYAAYQGLHEEDRAVDAEGPGLREMPRLLRGRATVAGSYWLVGTPAEAKAHCQALLPVS